MTVVQEIDRPATQPTATWVPVCELGALVPERGAAALVGSRQVALFRLHDGTVRAIDNRDPFSGAHVLARGIVGSRGDRATVASPMHKQVFDLETGACLDDPAVVVDVFEARVQRGTVEIRIPEQSSGVRPA